MPFLQNEHFRWNEPKEFLRIQDTARRPKLRPWQKPVAFVLLAALMMMGWGVEQLNPQNEPPTLELALVYAFAAAWLFVFALPWLNSRLGSTVQCYDTFLSRGEWSSHLRIKYADIEWFSWRVRDDFAILTLKQGSREAVLLGVPLEISREAVSQFLIERNVPCDADAERMPE